MILKEIFNLVWINILENKRKVMLTSLGIIVGAATIVLVIAIGQGSQKDVEDQFKTSPLALWRSATPPRPPAAAAALAAA